MRLNTARLILTAMFVVLQFSHFGNTPVAEPDYAKLHPRLKILVNQDVTQLQAKTNGMLRANTYTDPEGNTRYGVIIRTDDPNEVRSAGIMVNTEFDGFVTANVTAEQMNILPRLYSVSYVDLPSVNYPKMNVSTSATGASVLHNGFFNDKTYAGEGAIVVIYDSGIDWDHIDFKDPADTTKSRILAIWDQKLTPISGESSPAAPYNYGVEYTKAHIDDELDGTPTGFVRQKDTNGHGTHVAGTAAGSGGKFTGIAPKADIIVIKGGDGSFSENNIIDGLGYAEAKASALGKPVVVNLSLGGHSGPHDGTRSYEQVIDDFNSKAGQVVVIAGGNEGNMRMHTSGSVSNGGTVTINVNIPQYTPNDGTEDDEIWFEVWYDENVAVTAKATSPNGITHQQGFNTSGTGANNNDGTIYIENQRDGNKQGILFYVYDQLSNKTPAVGTWKFELVNAQGNLNYHGWLVKSGDWNEGTAALENGDNDYSVAMPGTADKAITVGAYVTKTSWPAFNKNQYLYSDDDYVGGIANFSSHGPTRDNRMKPDITAPGKGIVAAHSSDSEGSDTGLNPDGLHILSQGTSMATPHVAGAVAVMLAAQPSLTADQIKITLGQAAYKDSETSGAKNNTWGDGKLDLLEALVKIESPDLTTKRSIVHYDTEARGPYYEFTVPFKLGVRYKAPHSGKLTGAYLSTVSSLFDVDPQYVTYPVIDGEGTISVSVYEGSNAGTPGTQLGSTVVLPVASLDAGTNNYMDISSANVEVNEGEYYYLVLSISDGFTKVKILFDDGATELPDNRTVVHNGRSWSDTKGVFGKPYNLRLHSELTGIGSATGLESTDGIIANRFELDQNYPNPFNPSTRIKFSIANQGAVELSVFDILGRKVVTLVDGDLAAGQHEVQWNSQNNSGYRVPTGMYFYRLRSQDGVLTRKMLLVK